MKSEEVIFFHRPKCDFSGLDFVAFSQGYTSEAGIQTLAFFFMQLNHLIAIPQSPSLWVRERARMRQVHS